MNVDIHAIIRLLRNDASNYKDLAAKQQSDAAGYRALGRDAMADWCEGRQAAFNMASESFAALADYCDPDRRD